MFSHTNCAVVSTKAELATGPNLLAGSANIIDKLPRCHVCDLRTLDLLRMVDLVNPVIKNE